MSVMIPAIFLLAWAGTNSESPLPTYPRISLGWLSLPVFLVIGVAGWSIWAAQPNSQASAYAQSGDWASAAGQASISASRDPNSYIYTSTAGTLWACQAHTAKDMTALIRARGYLEQTLRLEPTTSWNWANLAMLDEASGELDVAIDHMQRAVKLSPNLPSYWFNLGRFYEQSSLPEMAISSYQKALNLEPNWRDLALWNEYTGQGASSEPVAARSAPRQPSWKHLLAAGANRHPCRQPG